MSGRIKRFFALLAVVLLPLGAGVALSAISQPAHAITVGFPVTTAITNDYDSGGNGNWANDDFSRTFTMTQQNSTVCSDDTKLSPGFNSSLDTCYSAAINDAGTFTTLLNAYEPNQGFSGPQTGDHIANVVSGTFSGGATWTLFSPNANQPDVSNVLATLDDSFTHPPSGANSTTQWFLQAFAPGDRTVANNSSDIYADMQADWSWTYNTGCETWVDSGSKGAGNNGFDGQSTPLSVDGNITGTICSTPPPPATDVVTVTFPNGNESTEEGNSVDDLTLASSSAGHAISTFSAVGLPPGLSIDSGGTITGTPTASGVYNPIVTATDSIGTTGSNSFSWTVTIGSTPPPPSGNTAACTSSYGNEVNPYGNGFNDYQQNASVNAVIDGWPATQNDPASHFLCQNEGSNIRLEYAPHGVGDGLCVSNPGDDLLVLRDCNSAIWQQFTPSGRYLISAVNGQYVEPNGTGGQLFTSSSHSAWGGDKYNWTAFSSLPA
jgi:Putative Ig domain